ncbi:MAG: hypothetical protein ACR2KZ_19595, partial [Segetibacter sp.]
TGVPKSLAILISCLVDSFSDISNKNSLKKGEKNCSQKTLKPQKKARFNYSVLFRRGTYSSFF